MSSLRLLPLLTSVFAVASVRGVGLPPASPEAMAAEVRALVSSGAGALMSDLDRAYIADGGLVPLGEGDFPAMFLHGLVAEWRDGVAVFPVEVRLDDATGDAYFLDALGEPFWYIPSEVPERYRPWLVANPWFAPSRAGIRWTFVHDADVALLRAASAPRSEAPSPRGLPPQSSPLLPAAPSLRGLSPQAGGGVTNLCFTGFSCTGTSVWFSAAWPSSALPLPGDTLDVYAKTNLLDAHWFPLAELPVAPAATNATLEIAGEDIPGFFVPPHVHDDTCPAVTNVTFDLVSNQPVTGIVYRCHRYRAVSSGFLRLGTRLDTDGDGLPDAAEMLVYGTRPDRLDTDGDGVPDGIAPMDWFSNPLWATNGMDADFLVDIVAPTDGSAETVLTLDGWRIPLSPRAGPWAFSLPPGEIVSCSVASTGPFFVLWAGTSGGSFWNLPESFEKPVWTYGMSSVSGNHETAGSCQIAVPVLTVTPILPAPSIPATSPSGSHVSSDGSVCVHASDGIQRFAWTIAPSIAGSGRTPSVTGAVRLDSEGPYIDVSDATDVRTGSLSFAENAGGNGIGTIWGTLSATLSAHRCDATEDNDWTCSVCGCTHFRDCRFSVSPNGNAVRCKSPTRIHLTANKPVNWDISSPKSDGMRLYPSATGGVPSTSLPNANEAWVSAGEWPEACLVTASSPADPFFSETTKVWSLAVCLAPITGEQDSRGCIVNPAGSAVGWTETFRIEIDPEEYVAESGARWMSSFGAAISPAPSAEARATFSTAGTDLLFFLMPGYLGELPQTLCEVYPSVSRVPLYRFYILDENGDRPSNLPDTDDDLAEINRIWRQAGMEFYWAGATDISNHSSYFIVNGNESFLEDLCSVMPSPNGISLGSAIDSLLMNGRGFLTHQVDIPRGRIKGFDDRDTLVHLRTGLLELDRSPSSLESSEP